jgi:hypothetical protein
MATSRSLLLGAAFGAGALVGRASASSQLRFARMSGSSIAGPDAAGWITDFLNAAYYRRDPAGRDVTTCGWRPRSSRPAGICWGIAASGSADAVPFHSAFGRDRFVDGARSARGTLDRSQLLDGAAACSARGSPTRTATPGAAAGASPSRARTSARRMTRRCACGWRGSARRRRRRRPDASRPGTRIRR